jgi:hypothetical protein
VYSLIQASITEIIELQSNYIRFQSASTVGMISSGSKQKYLDSKPSDDTKKPNGKRNQI